jgi:protein-S-isoprenylcysteine O-methyltransferase Ste14
MEATAVPAREDLAVRERPTFWTALRDPRVDRSVAVLACLPFAWMVYYRLFVEQADVPRIALSINTGLLILTMVARRPPVRVTPKPLYWATAFLATYWMFLTLVLGLFGPGTRLVPVSVTNGLAVASLLVVITARVSLGRNIGFVPAQRELVTSGAYAVVRHPIYTAMLLAMAGVGLRSYSPSNVLLLAIGAGLFVVKCFMEERFLSEDPTYARYMERVRSRFIPFVA